MNGQASMIFAGGWGKVAGLTQGGLLARRPRTGEGGQRGSVCGQRWSRSSCGLDMNGRAVCQ